MHPDPDDYPPSTYLSNPTRLMVVALSAAAHEATGTHHFSPREQFLQTPTLSAWGPAPLGILVGLFLQGASFFRQGPLVVTNNTPPIPPGIIYAQISYYFQTKIATRRLDNLMVIVLALLSTGKTMHSVSIVSIAYKEALIYPDLPNSFVSGSNTINFVIQPILVSDH